MINHNDLFLDAALETPLDHPLDVFLLVSLGDDDVLPVRLQLSFRQNAETLLVYLRRPGRERRKSLVHNVTALSRKTKHVQEGFTRLYSVPFRRICFFYHEHNLYNKFR